MRRTRLAVNICGCIEFLRNDYRRHSHLDEIYGQAYYWNERDVHWALYRQLRESYSIGGSEWWVHAEGTISRPKFTRKKQWKGMKRADIVVINHSRLKKWMREKVDEKPPPYEVMIEIKLIWPGDGTANTVDGINADFRKLEACLNKGTTKSAFFILLDGLDAKHKPYFQKNLENFSKKSALIIYHWPDSKDPIDNPKNADFRKY